MRAGPANTLVRCAPFIIALRGRSFEQSTEGCCSTVAVVVAVVVVVAVAVAAAVAVAVAAAVAVAVGTDRPKVT